VLELAAALRGARRLGEWEEESVMRSLLLLPAVLVGVVFASGCVMTRSEVSSLITANVRSPIAVGDSNVKCTNSNKVQAEGILIVAFGDASIETAMKTAKPPITKIHHVDSEVLNVLGIYGRSTITVYGE
jgi:hypothetical protein